MDKLKGIEKISNKIVNGWIDKNYITSDFEEWYTYGLYSFFSGIINILIFIVLGLIFNCFFQTLIFLAAFSVSREFMGGYHSDTPVRCKVFSVLIYAFVMTLSSVSVLDNYCILFFAVNFVLGNAVIYKLSPVPHHNKVLDENRQRLFKKLSFIIFNLFLFVGLSVSGRYIEATKIIDLTLCVVYILSVVGYYKERKYFL